MNWTLNRSAAIGATTAAVLGFGFDAGTVEGGSVAVRDNTDCCAVLRFGGFGCGRRRIVEGKSSWGKRSARSFSISRLLLCIAVASSSS